MSIFFDPLTNQEIEWEGNWRTLEKIAHDNVAVELSLRIRSRLDQYDDHFMMSLRSSSWIALTVKGDSIYFGHNAFQRTDPVKISYDEWHTLRWIVKRKHTQVYLDNVTIFDMTELPMHLVDIGDSGEFFDLTGNGFFDLAVRAKNYINIDDVEIRTNWISEN